MKYLNINKDETINGYRTVVGRFNGKGFNVVYDYSTGWWEEDSDVLTDKEFETIVNRIENGKYKNK